jgi:uncharacterized protein (TIGR02099 family)
MHPVESAEAIVEAILPPPRSPWRAAARFAGWSLVALYFLFALIVLVLRYWVLPKVGDYKDDIERAVSAALKQRVTIGAIQADWQGLRPELLLGNFTIHDRDGRPALVLPEVDATLAWTSIVFGSPRFYSLVFDRPRLEVRRDGSGKLFVAGMELRAGQGGEAGFAAWLLAQREIEIREANLTWVDEQRGAPTLMLTEVNALIRGRFTHRFAIRAKAPPELASALDLRGEVSGGGIFGDWKGRLFAQIDSTDLVAWQKWFDYPFVLVSGRGGVRVWLEFTDKALTDATADVALSQVTTRLQKDLPTFELASLQGRLGASRREGRGYEVFGRKITLTTGAGVTLPPADFRVRWMPGEAGAPETGEVGIDALELAPLVQLAEYLPLPQTLRQRLDATGPRGTIDSLRASWVGDPGNPQRYSVRGSFAGLALRASSGIPGFSGITAKVDANERNGSVVLASKRVTIELPGILPEDLQLDSLSGRVTWRRARDRVDVGLDNLSIANGDLAGAIFGSYATRRGGPGFLDVTGTLTRADGRAAYRYVPFLPPAVTQYLRTSIRQGRSNDVRLRLRGDLAKFPFADTASGVFRIVAKVSDANVQFADDWPAATGVSGDLVFDGKAMRIAATKAGILNLQASSLGVVVPDLYHGDEHVLVDIHSEDQTADFLDFIRRSPVTKALDGITDSMRASGVGRLALQIDIPIRKPERFKLAGDYQVVSNELRIDPDEPPFSQLNGRLEFTESGMSARALTSKFLGGPATVSVTTRDGAINVDAQGTANVAQIPSTFGEALLRRLSGAAAWRGSLQIARKKSAKLVVESNLTGVASGLPAPFGKAAVDPMPLRVERDIDSGDSPGDLFKVSLGPSINALFERSREGSRYELKRGVIALNEPAVLPDAEGLALLGSLPYVDVDRWRELLPGAGDAAAQPLSLKLRIGALDFAGRRLNDLDLSAGTSGKNWIAVVASKELGGEIKWEPDGSGRIVARLKHLTMPEATPGATEGKPARDLPALDIIADQLKLKGRDFGRLELVAVNRALDWQIDKLVLTGPESTLTVAKGVWQNWALQPSVRLDGVELRVNDIGKFLDSVGFPGTVRSGSATLKGNLTWDGSPQSIDFASLGGNLDLKAERGQFLKADPGVAKLIGILSMQSWVSLDFRELFNRGFAFDTVSCSAGISDGVLKTDNFRMKGPSAQVQMSGTTDLERETQDLSARVEPSVGDTLSVVLGAAINPVWGLGSLIVQKILKNPLGQAFAFEYRITGTWTHPDSIPVKLNVQTPRSGEDRP